MSRIRFWNHRRGNATGRFSVRTSPWARCGVRGVLTLLGLMVFLTGWAKPGTAQAGLSAPSVTWAAADDRQTPRPESLFEQTAIGPPMRGIPPAPPSARAQPVAASEKKLARSGSRPVSRSRGLLLSERPLTGNEDQLEEEDPAFAPACLELVPTWASVGGRPAPDAPDRKRPRWRVPAGHPWLPAARLIERKERGP